MAQGRGAAGARRDPQTTDEQPILADEHDTLMLVGQQVLADEHRTQLLADEHRTQPLADEYGTKLVADEHGTLVFEMASTSSPTEPEKVALKLLR